MRGRVVILPVVVSLVMSLVTAAVATDETPIGTFWDDNGNIHEGYIEAMADAGVTEGCNPPANTLYCPSLGVTRQQMASFLVRALGLPAGTQDYFVDDDDSIHEDDINALYESGITKGCNPPTNDRFCPTQVVSRQQMAAFLTRAMGYTDDDPAEDRFVDDNGLIFEAEIEALAAAGVTLGCNPPANDRFCPTGTVLRDQMASFLGRAIPLTPVDLPNELAVVFFGLDQPELGPYLAPVARYVTTPVTPELAVDLLIEGPTPGELAQTPAFSHEFPAGVVRNGPIDIDAGVATVDLSENFDDGGGTFTMGMRLAQLTYTLTAFPDIDLVELELDGVEVDVFSSEGLVIDGGMAREDFFNQIPEHFADSPAWWQYVESPIEVTGYSRAFEATIEWELYDRDGLLIASDFETTGSAGPDFGPMNFTVDYDVDELQVGTLMIFEISAMDGSRTDLRETVVWLIP